MLSELKMVGNWFKTEPESAWQFDEIAFDEKAKNVFSSLNLTMFEHSARMDIRANGNHCYLPCHYFLYALKMRPFMNLLNSYMNIFAEVSSTISAADFDNMIVNGTPTRQEISSLDTYSRENFLKLFKDKHERLEAKNIINSDQNKGKKYRTIEDFVISIILKTLPVPDNSSILLGKIIYMFSNQKEEYEYLSGRYSSCIPYLFSAPDGDGLLLRILSSLGWEGKIDSLLGNDTNAEFIDWGGIGRALLLRPRALSGNEQYVETPVHYSVLLEKYVFIKKGLLDTAESLDKISGLVSAIWSGMSIRKKDGLFFFESSARSVATGPAVTGGTNRIFYGAPGTGKSHRVHEYMSADAEKVVTVFHADTQHNDFTGALKPKTDRNDTGAAVITYQFRPGPFTSSLILAKSRPDRPVCLIIEEINRASAAAVFGELFQLLDRNANGESTYRIDATDPDMLDYINSELISLGCPVLDKLEIPSNLSLLATMNSSDQAVMPLDTAFKRRWSFEYLPIDFSNPDIPQTDITLTTQTGKYVVRWPDFAKVINETLVECDIAEDRLIGPFFLNANELAGGEKTKASLNGKLFIYLWDDLLRHFGHQKLFSYKYKTFGHLSAAFSNDEAVFCSSVEAKLEAAGTRVGD
ncbi:AAA family ATPase [Xenorhabdus anantnagensis]|uniref:AAA family ATPase n=1 Tax=Xenorhabdus anantnagensis TaxID=3025875 RepID=A0ABT5LY14_9GAMM|nr:AAA family ATPase [Xenorhabdus anantnagensis]MDC9597934.1 AAA family ATPase [Xenorhabdus anantnagensis]